MSRYRAFKRRPGLDLTVRCPGCNRPFDEGTKLSAHSHFCTGVISISALALPPAQPAQTHAPMLHQQAGNLAELPLDLRTGQTADVLNAAVHQSAAVEASRSDLPAQRAAEEARPGDEEPPLLDHPTSRKCVRTEPSLHTVELMPGGSRAPPAAQDTARADAMQTVELVMPGSSRAPPAAWDTARADAMQTDQNTDDAAQQDAATPQRCDTTYTPDIQTEPEQHNASSPSATEASRFQRDLDTVAALHRCPADDPTGSQPPGRNVPDLLGDAYHALRVPPPAPPEIISKDQKLDPDALNEEQLDTLECLLRLPVACRRKLLRKLCDVEKLPWRTVEELDDYLMPHKVCRACTCALIHCRGRAVCMT